ncbi:MAG: arsenate reductase (glutaredoxin) [Candidatus Hydrogenedentota bacterium]
MSDITIYHNPRCSKSRQTLALLKEKGADPVIIDYLNDPPSVEDLRAIHEKLGGEASALLRRKEAEYAESGLSSNSAPEAIYEAITCYPKLLERPIVVRGGQAVIGRPPETIEQLF